MNKHKTLLLAVLVFSFFNTFAQTFTITCIKQEFINGEPPSIYLFGVDNLFQENPFYHAIALKKNKDLSWSTELQNVRPVFFQLDGAQILALPNQKVTGYLQNNNQDFVTNDTNNINYLLQQTSNHILSITATYRQGAAFSEFTARYDSIKKYNDIILKQLVDPKSKIKYSLSNESLSALRQYYSAKLAHFAMLPILLHNNYTDKLIEFIKRDIKISEPRYWFETQWGRIFLKTFFTKYLLPEFNYNLEESLAFNNFFVDKTMRKFLSFLYFDEALNKQEDMVNLDDIRKNFLAYQKEYSFTDEEQKMLSRIKEKMTAKNQDIVELFAKQNLLDIDGLELNDVEKENLLKNDNAVIIDYWASWCAPCREKISKLTSDAIILKGKKYKMIFISIDNNQQNWLGSKYPIFTKNNSFRLTEFKKPSLYTAFKVTAIPRLILVENARLKSENFSY